MKGGDIVKKKIVKKVASKKTGVKTPAKSTSVKPVSRESLHLMLAPDVIKKLRSYAKKQKQSVSAIVARLLEKI